MASRTTDKDLGLEAIIAEMRRADGAEVLIGLQQGDVNADGKSIAEYAGYNEFGTKDIPSRPFMRQAFDMHVDEIGNDLKKVVSGITGGTLTAQVALSIVGQRHEARLKKRIVDLRDPSNAASTIRRKKSSNPLIDTGAMLNSVRFIVKRGS